MNSFTSWFGNDDLRNMHHALLAETTRLLENMSIDDNLNQKRSRSRGRSGKKGNNMNGTEGSDTALACLNPFMQAIERPLRVELPRAIQQPTEIVMDKYFLNCNLQSPDDLVQYEDISSDSKKFKEIRALFPPSMIVFKVQQVFNPMLRLSFQLKQELKFNNLQPLKLFHGTKLKYVHNICTYNFNWRYSGVETGHKFGKGVNFTSKPKFAMNFCKEEAAAKVMILSEVLVSKKIEGYPSMVVPPDTYDTSIGDKNGVFVKFDDAEFYPSYVIFFCKCENVIPKVCFK